MDEKKTNTLLFIAGIGLTVAGIIFLLVAIFGENYYPEAKESFYLF